MIVRYGWFMSTKKKELIEGMVILCTGFMTLIEGIRLSVYKDVHSIEDIVGPGRYLIFLSIFMIAIGVIYFVSNFKNIKGKTITASDVKSSPLKTLPIILVLIIYIVYLYLIGYLGSTLIFFILMHRVMGFQSWTINIAVSVLISLFLYGLFVSFLGMIFPHGVLF